MTQIRARDFCSNDNGIAELVPVFCTYELIILFKCDENVKTLLFAKNTVVGKFSFTWKVIRWKRIYKKKEITIVQ